MNINGNEYINRQQPVNQHQMYNYNIDTAPVMTVTDWIIVMLLMCVPILNIILIVIWALDSNTNPSKRNWAKAYLIVIAVMFVVAIAVIISLGSFISGFMTGLGNVNY